MAEICQRVPTSIHCCRRRQRRSSSIALSLKVRIQKLINYQSCPEHRCTCQARSVLADTDEPLATRWPYPARSQFSMSKWPSKVGDEWNSWLLKLIILFISIECARRCSESWTVLAGRDWWHQWRAGEVPVGGRCRGLQPRAHLRAARAASGRLRLHHSARRAPGTQAEAQVEGS